MGGYRFCPECGARLDEGERYCGACGYDFAQRLDASRHVSAATAEMSISHSNTSGVNSVAGGVPAGTGRRDARDVGDQSVFSSPSGQVTSGQRVSHSAQWEASAAVPPSNPPEEAKSKGKVWVAAGSILFIILLLVCRTAFRTVVSEANSEQVIRSGIEREVQEINDDFIKKAAEESIAEDPELADFESVTGMGYDEFLKKALEGFDIQVDDVIVNGDSGTVWLTVSSKDLSGFDDELDEELASALESGALTPEMTEEDVSDWYGGIIMKLVDEAPFTSEKCEVGVQRKGNEWSLDGDYLEAFLSKKVWGIDSSSTAT